MVSHARSAEIFALVCIAKPRSFFPLSLLDNRRDRLERRRIAPQCSGAAHAVAGINEAMNVSGATSYAECNSSIGVIGTTYAAGHEHTLQCFLASLDHHDRLDLVHIHVNNRSYLRQHIENRFACLPRLMVSHTRSAEDFALV